MPKLLSIIVMLATTAATTAAAQAATILITDFDPFGGATVNNSTIVAAQIQKRLKGRGINVKVCRLPVVYEAGAAAAKAYYQAMAVKPQMVLSLGEGECTLRLETAAQNLDSSPGFPDNAGNIRTDEVIQPGAPMSLPLKTFIGDMYCSLPKKQRNEIEISASPGGFICNDVAYRMGAYFSQTTTPFSFIHVPTHSCGQSAVQTRSVGDTIAAMVAGLPQLGGHDALHFSSLQPLMPTATEQADRLLQALGAEEPSPAQACGIEFTTRLKTRLEDWSPKQTINYF